MALSDKLRDIIAAIEQRGSVNVTRLTVTKRWFEVPGHLPAFGVFIADRASRRKTGATQEARDLIREARTLLDGVDEFAPRISCRAAERLHASLEAFQNDYRNIPWGAKRLIRGHNLFLIESGLHVYLKHERRPADGYRLAVSYCENYDPRYGNGLNGPSRRRINEIIDFVDRIEAIERVRKRTGHDSGQNRRTSRGDQWRSHDRSNRKSRERRNGRLRRVWCLRAGLRHHPLWLD